MGRWGGEGQRLVLRGSGYELGLIVLMRMFLRPFESFRKSWIVFSTVMSLSVVMSPKGEMKCLRRRRES